MALPVVYRRKVGRDLAGAYGWYEEQRAGCDPLALTLHDPDHSGSEQRLLTFGLSRQNRLLIVSHTARAPRVRIISARRMSRRERKIYEEG